MKALVKNVNLFPLMIAVEERGEIRRNGWVINIVHNLKGFKFNHIIS